MQCRRVVDVFSQDRNQFIVVHGVKILLNVQIDDPFIPFVKIFQCFADCPMAIPVWPEAVAVVTEIPLIAE